MTKILHSLQETKEFTRQLAKELKPGQVLGLVGELGTGKTVIVKEIAKTLGVKEFVTSPTFILMKIYPTEKEIAVNKPLYLVHLDCYRLTSPLQFIDLGVKEYLGRQDTITVIEWAEKIFDFLPPRSIIIKLQFGKKPEERIIIQT